MPLNHFLWLHALITLQSRWIFRQLLKRCLAVNGYVYYVIVRVVSGVQAHPLGRVRRILYPEINIQAIHLAMVYIFSICFWQVRRLTDYIKHVLFFPGNIGDVLVNQRLRLYEVPLFVEKLISQFNFILLIRHWFLHEIQILSLSFGASWNDVILEI
jgi:hypothetical protein